MLGWVGMSNCPHRKDKYGVIVSTGKEKSVKNEEKDVS